MFDFETAAKNGIVNEGNVSRLKKMFSKLRDKKPVTIGAIGGSITEGARSTKPEFRYHSVLGEWMKDYFKNPNITVINAGVGATNSLYGLFRADRDILCFEPDFVIVDYCCNDFLTDEYMKNEYEMLVRKILSAPFEPAVMLYSFSKKDGTNTQSAHTPVAPFYDIPALSYRDAYYPEIEKGRLEWSDISPDEVHPNDTGHRAAAILIEEFLKAVDRGEAGDDSPYHLREDSLNGFMFKNPRLLGTGDITPVDFGDFEVAKTPYYRVPLGFSAKKAGRPIVFKVKCANIGLAYLRWNTNDFGRALMTIDGEEFLLDGHFPADWGGFMLTKIYAANLENTEHTISVKLLDDKPEGSTGEKFIFCYLLLAD